MNKIKIYLSVFFAVFYLTACSQNFFWSHNKISGFTVKYGALYNWYAATDSRKITSSDDWVVTTYPQTDTLTTYLGGNTVSGGKLKETGLTYWDSPNSGATNEVGFNARGAGKRIGTTGAFSSIKAEETTWTSTIFDLNNGRESRLAFSNNTTSITNATEIKSSGLPIRLIYVGAGTPTEYVGNDGKKYRVVTIGTQTWLADNLCETKFRNGDVIPWYGANPANYFTNAEWAALTTAGMCAYNNDLSNVAVPFSFP